MGRIRRETSMKNQIQKFKNGDLIRI